MKKTIYVLLIIAACLYSLPAILKPVILSVSKKQLSVVFKDSAVSVRDCRLRPVSLAIYGIKVKRGGLYDIQIEQARVSYRFSALFRGELSRLALKGVTVNINTPARKISQFTQLLNLDTSRPAPFRIAAADLQAVKLDLKTQDLNFSGEASVGIDLSRDLVYYLALKVNTLDGSGMLLTDVSLGSALRGRFGNLYIGKAEYNKVKLRDIYARVILGDKGIALDPLSMKLFSGDITGGFYAGLDKEARYALDLKVSGVALEAVVNDLELGEKFRMTGRLSGAITANGSQDKIMLVDGDLAVVQPGGALTITDEGFLKNLAASTQQSLDMLVEGFKDYHYDTGVIRLGLEKGGLVMTVALDGANGKRDLSITLHDFNLKDYLPK